MDQMLRQMTTRQFLGWCAYADVEPFDEERADARAAQVVQAIHGHSRTKATGKTLRDCMLKFERPQKATPEERRGQIVGVMRALMAEQKALKKKRKPSAQRKRIGR